MKTPLRSLRLHIGLLGRTNVGKSSFLNFVVGQDVAITSPVLGTTTDIVEKAAELLPIGPAVFLDTAGFDDPSELGEERRLRARKALEREEIVTVLVEHNIWARDEEIESEAKRPGTPIVVVVSRCDTASPSPSFLGRVGAGGRPVMCCRGLRRETRHAVVNQFKDALLRVCPEDFLCPPPLLGSCSGGWTPNFYCAHRYSGAQRASDSAAGPGHS